MAKSPKLKLFIWECDLGVVFALAHSMEEALKLVVDKDPIVADFIDCNPLEITRPEAFICFGRR